MTLPASQPNYFDSTEVGIPQVNNVAGSGLEAIRACVKNGFNPRVVTSIVVASGVATATAASHGYTATYGKLLLIEGSGEALLNGRKQPLSVATNTFTYAAPGVADGTYTGTMSAKRAPLGWTEKFTGTNTAIFTRSAPEATTLELRINDSHANGSTVTDMRVVMVESSTDVDTYVDHSPTTAQLSGGGYWYKGANSATAKKWAIVGNDRFFWFMHPTESNAAPYNMQINHFGDGAPFRTPDPYFCLLSATPSSGGTSGPSGAGLNVSYGAPSSFNGGVVARNFSAASKSVITHKSGASAGSALGIEAAGQFGSDVVAISRTYHLVEPDINSAGGHLRGEAPGLAGPLARLPFAALGQFAIVTPAVGDGRTYLSVLYTAGSSARGNALLNLTGPWF